MNKQTKNKLFFLSANVYFVLRRMREKENYTNTILHTIQIKIETKTKNSHEFHDI